MSCGWMRWLSAVARPHPRHAMPFIYSFNICLPFSHTGESTWDHPCDEYYRKLYEEEKKKKMTKDKAKHDKSKQQVNF